MALVKIVKSKRGKIAASVLAAVVLLSVLWTSVIYPLAFEVSNGQPVSVRWGYLLKQKSAIADLVCSPSGATAYYPSSFAEIYQEPEYKNGSWQMHTNASTRPDHVLQMMVDMNTVTESQKKPGGTGVDLETSVLLYCVQNGINVNDDHYTLYQFNTNNVKQYLGIDFNQCPRLEGIFGILATFINPASNSVWSYMSDYGVNEVDQIAAVQCLLWEFSSGFRTVNDLLPGPIYGLTYLNDANAFAYLEGQDPLKTKTSFSIPSYMTGKQSSARCWKNGWNGMTFGGKTFSKGQYYQTVLWNFYGNQPAKRPAFYVYYYVLNLISCWAREPDFKSDVVKTFETVNPSEEYDNFDSEYDFGYSFMPTSSYNWRDDEVAYIYRFDVKDRAANTQWNSYEHSSFANYDANKHDPYDGGMDITYHISNGSTSVNLLYEYVDSSGGWGMPDPNSYYNGKPRDVTLDGVTMRLMCDIDGFMLATNKPLSGKYTITASHGVDLQFGSNKELFPLYLATPNNNADQALITGHPGRYTGTFSVTIDVPDGYAQIRKTSQSNCEDIVNGNSLYSVENAGFRVYTADGADKGVYWTKADGRTDKIQLPVGSYYAVEVKAPAGHMLGEEGKKYTFEVTTANTSDKPIEIVVENPIVHDPLPLNGFVDKDWSEKR